MLFTDADVAEVRHIVQHILVPCVFVVGLLGNSVSIYVLTRKRMRCTTNIYLTALAITDIIYLTMALLLSLKHNDYVRRHCEIYWRHYGTVVWLCDACAYISIYIAVCFTIERFIAIRYPLKRQTFCTESLAKRVITGVALFCLLSTISTAFEHQYLIDYKLIDNNGRPCNATEVSPLMSAAPSMDLWRTEQSDNVFYGSGNEGASHENFQQKMRGATVKSSKVANIPNNIESSEFLNDAVAKFVAGAAAATTTATELQHSVEQRFDSERNDSRMTAAVDYCQNVTFYVNSYSSLGLNELYTRIWYFFTLFVFVLIPLCVLATFNFFLIMLVRRSKSLRGEMTNASSIRRPKRKTTISAVSQENRVTVTLIAVVLLFIVCQLPWAIYLIVSEHVDIEANLQAIIGNIFNFLAAINAAANFFLYCVLSDKYRSMVRQLITGYRYRSQSRNNTSSNHHNNHHNNNHHNNSSNNTSLYISAATTTTNGSRRYRSTIIK